MPIFHLSPDNTPDHPSTPSPDAAPDNTNRPSDGAPFPPPEKGPRGLKFYHSLIIFAVVIAAMLFIAAPLQYAFGMAGLAATELLLLAIALAAARLSGGDFRDTLSLRLPRIKHFFAGLLLYAGIYAAVIPVSLFTQYLFPQAGEISQALTDFGTTVPPLLAVFIMAFLPAVCEESVFRGVILSGFRQLRKPVVIALITGILFGIFHLDLFRFLPTAMLGFAFSYITLRSGSILTACILHFLNNVMSVYSMYLMKSAETAAEETVAFSLSLSMLTGISLIYLAFAAAGIYLACRLFSDTRAIPHLTLIVMLIALFLFIAGAAIYTSAILNSQEFMELIRQYAA